MTTKNTVLETIEVTESGAIQLLFYKQTLEDGVVVAQGNHRSVIESGGDIDAQFALINSHLEEMGFPAVSEEDINRVKNAI